MLPPRWFAVGSAEGAEPDTGVRAVDQALLTDGLSDQVLSVS
jgi:hypothetical protein